MDCCACWGVCNVPGQHAAEAVRRAQIVRAAYRVACDRGLHGLRVRDVASRAGVSNGLVIFHFKSKDGLLLALLDWLLATTTVLHVTDDVLAIPEPLDRLLAVLRTEMNRLSSEPQRIRLFFDFWARGMRHPAVRTRMRRELARYREAFRPIAHEVLQAEPERFGGVTAAGLSGVAVSFIKGCAVQSMIDPSFDIDQYLAAANGLISELARASR